MNEKIIHLFTHQDFFDKIFRKSGSYNSLNGAKSIISNLDTFCNLVYEKNTDALLTEIIKKIKDFTESRNLIAHRKRGLSISKDGITFYLGKHKDGTDNELTEADRFLIMDLGRECLKELTGIREEMKKSIIHNLR